MKKIVLQYALLSGGLKNCHSIIAGGDTSPFVTIFINEETFGSENSNLSVILYMNLCCHIPQNVFSGDEDQICLFLK